MSRSLLHDWEQSIENLSIEMRKIAEDIYNTAYARGKNHSDVTEVFDKIRAEITKLQTYKMFVGEDTVYVERDDVLKIIDKYKAESEEKE